MDAATAGKVVVIGTFPEDTDLPIIYPAALTAMATAPDAATFPRAKPGPIFLNFLARGFTVLGDRRF